MTPADWRHIRWFRPDENWGDPERMSPVLLLALDALREYVGRPITINSGWRDCIGYHGQGCAADLYIEGLHLVDQYVAASRFDAFGGIGLYPWWHSPGLHLDTRAGRRQQFDALWGSTAAGVYVTLDRDFFRRISQ